MPSTTDHPASDLRYEKHMLRYGVAKVVTRVDSAVACSI